MVGTLRSDSWPAMLASGSHGSMLQVRNDSVERFIGEFELVTTQGAEMSTMSKQEGKAVEDAADAASTLTGKLAGKISNGLDEAARIGGPLQRAPAQQWRAAA